MRRLIWVGVWLVAFVFLFVAAYFAAETRMSPPRPGPRGFRDQGGIVRGFLITALAAFAARSLANRIAPTNREQSASEAGKLDRD